MTDIDNASLSSEKNTSVPPIDKLPDGLGKPIEELTPDQLNAAQLLKELQKVRKEDAQKRQSETFAIVLRGCLFGAIQKLPTLAIWLMILIITIAIVFYYLRGDKPFFPIDTTNISPSVPVPTDTLSDVRSPQTTFIILGQYDNELYTYIKGVKKIFAYSLDPNNSEERPVVSAPEFEKFLWNEGQLVFVSRADNSLGNIYVFDLTRNPPEPELPTQRENAPNFPPNLQVDNESQLAWSQNGELIAFTARSIENKRESLFIYKLGTLQLTYTPARDMDKISSLLWITNTLTTTVDTLSFVAISNGQENRYFIDSTGGGYSSWKPK